MTWPGVVRAAPDDSMDSSNELFDEGKKLLVEACSRFEESYRLQPRPGTLLNLALCHEAEGKLVAARRELAEALAAAREGGREDRISVAATHLTSVEARLSWLTIVPPPNVKGEAIGVTLDGAPVDRSLFGALPLEAGEHVVSVAAPGFRPRSMSVTTTTMPEQHTLWFDALDAENVGAASSAEASAPDAETKGPSSSTPQKVGLVAAVTGVVGIGLGAYFGLRAMGKKSDATANGCDDNGGCPPGAGMDTWRSARSNATVSTISFAAGGVLLAGGAAMYFAGGRAKPRSATLKAVPSASAHDLGLLVQGTF
jgi:serine/threonine-protein kinase